MDGLRELYQEVIIDHNRNPRNFHDMPNATCSANGFNPLCGDSIRLYLHLNNDVIEDVAFLGQGCAISTASASLMTDHLKGKTVEYAEQIFTLFHNMITKDDADAILKLGKLGVFAGVKEFPARVKCATLAWHTLDAALHNESESITTE